MNRIYLSFIVLIAAFKPTLGLDIGRFHSYVDSVTYLNIKFDPILATKLGIHDYDSLLPDLSKKALKAWGKTVKNEYYFLDKIDTTGWPIDDQIDYILEMSNFDFTQIDSDNPQRMDRAPALYPDLCIQAIFYPLMRDSRPMSVKTPVMLSRISKIPDFLKDAQKILKKPDYPEAIETQRAADLAGDVILDIGMILLDTFPDRNAEISTLRDKAILSLKNYAQYYIEHSSKDTIGLYVGKDNYRRMLKSKYFLDIAPDSLMKLAKLEFQKADSQVRFLNTVIPSIDYFDGMMHDVVTSPPEDSTIIYCQGEVKFLRNYLVENEIVTIPHDLSDVVFRKPPGYIYKQFYLPPGKLDKDSTAYFYSSFGMLNHEVGEDLTPDYFNWGFREQLIAEVLPGSHLQQQVARDNSSLTRRIQENNMMEHGWQLYCKELMIERGVLGVNNQIAYDFYKELRSYALGSIIEIGLHTDRFTLDSAQTMIRNLLGTDIDSYKPGLDETYSNPFHNLSYMLGRLLILDMRQNAKAKEGDKFSLKDFHDKILLEGCIPPALIAKKYGW